VGRIPVQASQSQQIREPKLPEIFRLKHHRTANLPFILHHHHHSKTEESPHKPYRFS
jgi:hypothetical protein